MLHDSVPKGPDRRRSPRFSLPIGRVSGGQRAVTLLNISRQGMAIEVPGSTGFTRGDSQSFTLQDLHHSVEVLGRVRWVRSGPRNLNGPKPVQDIQIVGVAFEEILTREPPGIWHNLQTIATESVTASPPGSPSLLEPQDGASLAEAMVTVVCRIAAPEEVTAISINGIGATLEGEQAMAEIALDPGVNRLTVLIWRQNGSYRSYSLGRVTRKEKT